MTLKAVEDPKPIETRLSGKTFAFFGDFSFWPSYHPGPPAWTARLYGATVCATVDEKLDYLVIGDKRGTGKADARKQASKLRLQAERAQKKGETRSFPEILDESAFRELVRIDLTGKTFCFFGGFDCCGGELDENLLSRMVQGVGAEVKKSLDENPDYVVMGNRKGEGKIAANNQVKKLQSSGASLELLNEEGFLELVRTDKPSAKNDNDGAVDFATFISRLHGMVDQGKLGRAMKMLKGEAFKLYVHKTDQHVVGVVRSQTGSSTVYASWLTPEGRYGCATAELAECMGLQGTPCKHLLVLIVGLTRAAEMDAETACAWLKASRGKRPRHDENLVADTFIQYKGAEVGEIDWRPTETIPEDYYAF